MASVIHYGVDTCHRITLLRQVGVDVAACPSLPDLRHLLEKRAFDAILLTESPTDPLIHTARRLSNAPLIWFCEDPFSDRDPRFDLVIPPLTPPAEWLASMKRLLGETRRIRAQSIPIRTDSESLRAAAADRRPARPRLQRGKDTRHPGG